MAFDAFLKLDGIPGGSQSKVHPGEIEISSFSWGETNVGNANSGGGAGAGKVQIQDFHFTMTTSKASPTLLKQCATGEHIKEATLSCRKSGGSQQDFMVIKMNDVIISSYQVGGASGDGDPTDSLSLVFGRIDFVFREFDEKGNVIG
jgi:type VI secretion system secreted protein Hcp